MQVSAANRPAGGTRAPITVAELERWQEHGATWRTVALSDERAVIELCTCYGEAVDLREGDSPELIEFVRAGAAGAQRALAGGDEVG